MRMANLDPHIPSSPYVPATLGRVLRSARTRELTITETRYSPNAKLPRHAHERATLCLVIRGEVSETMGRRSYRCLHSSLLLKPGGEPHADEYAAAGAHCLIVEFDRTMEDSFSACAPVLGRPLYWRWEHVGAAAARLTNELVLMDTCSPLAIEGVVLELLSAVGREVKQSQSPTPSWLTRARELIHAEFRRDIALGDVARAVGVDAAHLARVFRHRFGLSVGEYVRQLRMDRAMRELTAAEDVSLTQLASELGFYDQSHFCNLFKRYTGTTPATFRRNSRQSRRSN